VAPSLLSLKGTARRDMPATAPHPTVLAGGGHSALVAPHLATMRNSMKPWQGADEPAHTITAGGAGLTLCAPTLVQTGYGEAPGQKPRALDIGAPLGTVVAGGGKHALVATTIIGCGGRAAQSRPRAMDEPTATGTAKADACIASAFLAQHNTGVTARDPRDPMSTVTAAGSHQQPVAAFVARHFGASVGHAADEPTGTVTAGGGGKSSPVAAFFAKYYGTGDGARHDEPTHTVTTRDRFAHAQAALAAPPFGPEHEARARAVADFLRAHDAWAGGEFVTLSLDGAQFVVVDIGMRMLTPRELFNAQGFPSDYVIEGVWEGDTFRDFPKDVQVSCCGNSVCPPVAQAIIAANCQHLVVADQEVRHG
jgi:DNA (cytosine-5)-methyltransferase 1